MSKAGFDRDKYVLLQSENIRKRIELFGERLYLEFGGKLFDDYHASRVLPGYAPDSKVKMLMELSSMAEIVIVISAGDIERSKRRGDLGITYDAEVLRLIDAFRSCGLYVGSVCITHYAGQPAAASFRKRLEALGMPVFEHYIIPEYPTNVELIVSDEGFGRNQYIEVSRRLVVVTAPGPGSGKMATCLSQLYHESRRGVAAGYAKFETFPIWNLPLLHPVNLAYEAATADLDDVNMIDPYHLEAHGVAAVNYNRDVEIYPVLSAILTRMGAGSAYSSPTDMGVNMAGYAISDDGICRAAAKQEIIRRYYAAACDIKRGIAERSQLAKTELLMKKAGVSPADRPCVGACLKKAEQTGEPAMALELPDGTLVTGRTSALLGASAACLLNSLKLLAGIPDSVLLLSPEVIEPICRLKTEHMGNFNPRLHTDEVLIALSVCSRSDPNAAAALRCLGDLYGCEAHASVILSNVDESLFRKLGVNVTCESVYQTKKLYHR